MFYSSEIGKRKNKVNEDIKMNDVLNQDLMIKIIKSADIQELDLSVRAQGGLRRSGITTIGSLCQRTKLDLLRSEYLSIRLIDEIEKRLCEIGLCLKPLNFNIVTRNDWERQPVPNMAISFDLKLNLSNERYEALKRGNVPSNMDQWFVFYERGKLYFYRYTGLCYFVVSLNELTGVHQVKAYIHNPENIAEWVKQAPEMIKAILERYGDY